MRHKPSMYNFFLPYGVNYLAFNGMTGALAQIEPEHYEQYQNYVEHGLPLEESFLRDLLYAGFLVDSGLDERKLIKRKLLSNRYSTAALHLTVAPTMRCNFRCAYCYEEGAEMVGPMPEDVQESLLAFVAKHCAEIKSLHITWYGGEPLLAMPVIERLTERFVQLADAHHLTYTAAMVSNGYLLTPEVSRKLKELKVQDIQITLDGPPEYHNVRRATVDGKPTFERILANVIEAVDLLKVSVRVNVDKQNIDGCDKIIAIMQQKNLQQKIFLNFAAVDGNHRDEIKEQCYTEEHFSSYNMLFRRKLIAAGFADPVLYPFRKGNYCGADRQSSYVVDPGGYLYKCWSEIGFYQHAVGRLESNLGHEEKALYQKNSLDYLLFDPTEDTTCADCKMLPICMGGCPYTRKHSQAFCDEVKYQLEPILKNLVELELAKNNEGVSK